MLIPHSRQSFGQRSESRQEVGLNRRILAPEFAEMQNVAAGSLALSVETRKATVQRLGFG